MQYFCNIFANTSSLQAAAGFNGLAKVGNMCKTLKQYLNCNPCNLHSHHFSYISITPIFLYFTLSFTFLPYSCILYYPSHSSHILVFCTMLHIPPIFLYFVLSITFLPYSCILYYPSHSSHILVFCTILHIPPIFLYFVLSFTF